jgi:2-desacetyl-2-hydroxyethyl bacteriochlorophyllide A dehydrogenase
MKSLLCSEPHRLQLSEIPEPPLAGEGMIKVKIRRIGICGTDFHIFEGSHPFLNYPRVMGHELSGEVYETQPSSQFKQGDKVIINPYLPCGKCIACTKGKPNCCSNIKVLGVHADGGMCEYLVLPEAALYPAHNLSFDQAAMVEFLAIGAHAVRRAEIKPADNVLVVGAGPIGLGTAFFAQIAHAKVTVVDVSEARLHQATKLNPLFTTVLADATSLQKLSDITQGNLFDVVLDATGNKHSMQQSLHYVAHGGSCVFVSVVKDDIVFSDPLFHSREMRIIGSRNATQEDFETVINAITQGLIPTEKLNTHQSSLEGLIKNIPLWLTEKNGLIKAIAHIN